jgi:hypothetical protein
MKRLDREVQCKLKCVAGRLTVWWNGARGGHNMTHYRIFAVAVAILVAGCGYSRGSIDYSANPELRNVRLYTGNPDPLGEDLPTVEVFAEGRADCSAVASGALAKLLAQAEALGGEGVKDVKFRGRWHWMGRVVCRNGMSAKSVQVRGISYRLPDGD